MKDKNNISLIISGLALAVSLYALFGNKNENRFVKSNDKVYIPADPKAKNGIQEFKNHTKKVQWPIEKKSTVDITLANHSMLIA